MKAALWRKNLLLILALPGVCHTAVVSGAEPHGAIFQKAADEVGVPAELTQAIARVESRGNPYALNVEGRSFFFNSREEALAAARAAEAEGRSFDSGIMQINNWWLKRYNLPLEALWEPDANILLGSWILQQALTQSGGDTWRAVGLYHSPNAEKGRKYAALVRRALASSPRPDAGSAVKRGAVLTEPERTAFVQRWPIQAASSETGDAEEEQPAQEQSSMVVYRENQTPVQDQSLMVVYRENQAPAQDQSSMVVYRANRTPVFQREPAFGHFAKSSYSPATGSLVIFLP